MKIQHLMALVVLSLATVPGARAAVRAGPITNAANGHVYYLLSDDTWTASEVEARGLGGHLVTINDAAENQWVLNSFFPLTGVPEAKLWIGLNDAANEGRFVWASGEPVTFTYWYPGEPDDVEGVLGTADYAAIRHPSDGRWIDISDQMWIPTPKTFGVVELPMLLPVAVTQPADQFMPGSARLNGQANAIGSPTLAWFEWGTSLAYGNATSPQSVGSGYNVVGFSNVLAGLVSGPEYHFRARASNAFGLAAGADQTFNLGNQLPVVTTLAADQLSTTNARLRGQVNPRGWPTAAWFEWGTDTNYGNVIGMQDVGQGSSVSNLNVVLDGLIIGTEYHFRARASNAFGLVAGADQTFNLNSQRPVVTTLAADPLSTNSARLRGQVNPRGWPTTAWFEWGTDTDYGNLIGMQDVGQGSSVSTLNVVLSGLMGGPSYHYRLVATNAFGVVYGADQTFGLGFVPIPIPGLPGVIGGSVAWGDYDNDGRLDFLLTGYGAGSQLWRNTGSGFSNVTASVAPGLPGVSSSAAWGDYDNDGRLDFLLTGSFRSQLWRNTGAGFSNVTASVAPGLPGLESSSVAWGDYDNDGRLDFLLIGTTNFFPDESPIIFQSQLWRNTGSAFSNVTASVAPGLPGLYWGSVAWGDYDNDGRLDFLLTGGGGGQLWRNTGSAFSNVTASVAPGLPGGTGSSVAWGDYDNDGQLDFLLTGFVSGIGEVSQLWRNTGSGFSNVTAGVAPGLPGVDNGSVAWGDYDNDGRLDFLLTGSGISQLWRNTGAGFSNVTASVAPSQPGISRSVAWGDYDNDGRLDFLLTRSGQLWRNNMPIASNAPPAAPAGLSSTLSGATVSLNWNPPADDRTPSTGLNYNVRIGTTPGASDVLAPMALTDGLRLLPALGNAQAGTDAVMNLPFGRYYWSVQAVDTSFAGSPFSVEQQFTIAPRIVGPLLLSNGHFQFSFTNQSSAVFEVLGTTNVALPLAQWTVLGPPVSLGGGLYRFTDTLANNHAQRFYLLRQQ